MSSLPLLKSLNPALLRLPALLILALPTLSACLVDPDKPRANEYAITLPAQLRVYQDQDRNEYVVSGISTDINGSTSLFGNMWTKWAIQGTLTEQFSAVLLPDPMEETTVLTLNELEVGRVHRYIQQSPANAADGTEGTVNFVALEDGLPNSITWPVATPPADITTTPLPVFWSPLEPDDGTGTGTYVMDLTAHSQTLYLVNQCDATPNCTAIGSFQIASQQITGKALVNTLYGRFETYRIDYAGQFQPTTDGQQIPDIRVHCYDGTATAIVNFSGYMFVHPDVGVVKMVNSCNIGGSVYADITVELTHTTVALTPTN